jgi:hypothetical protein
MTGRVTSHTGAPVYDSKDDAGRAATANGWTLLADGWRAIHPAGTVRLSCWGFDGFYWHLEVTS